MTGLVLRETSEIATITRQVTRRGPKVYLDYLQNRYGQTIVAPFSVRPLPAATVSMPLVWSEVVDGLDPREFTIRNAVERLVGLGEDRPHTRAWLAVALPMPELHPVISAGLETALGVEGARKSSARLPSGR